MTGKAQVFNLYNILLFLLFLCTCLRIGSVLFGDFQDGFARFFSLFSSCQAVRLFVKGMGLTMLAFLLVCLFRAFPSSFRYGLDAHACLYGRLRNRIFRGCPALASFYRYPLRSYICGALPCPLAHFTDYLFCAFLAVSIVSWLMTSWLTCL